MLSPDHNSKLKPPPSYPTALHPLRSSRKLLAVWSGARSRCKLSGPFLGQRSFAEYQEIRWKTVDCKKTNLRGEPGRESRGSSRRIRAGGGSIWMVVGRDGVVERERKRSLARRWNGALAERKSGRVWNVNSFGFALFTFSPSFLIKLM
jgi:hypothetical protein